MNKNTMIAMALMISLSLVIPVQARVKLVALPDRDKVDMQLDYERATLIEEERTVALIQGENRVDFSWANTRIQSDSIVFSVIESSGKVNVLSVSYPPDESALVWHIHAETTGSAKIRISYLIDNLQRKHSYRAVANQQETSMELREYLRVDNYSQEGFEQVDVHLGRYHKSWQGVDTRESREVLLNRRDGVPVNKRFSVDVARFGYLDAAEKKLNVPMNYVIENQSFSGLGKETLAAGKVRIFQKDGQNGQAFLGEDFGSQTPIGESMELAIGMARDIEVKRFIEDHQRQRVAGNLYHHEVLVRYEIKNFKNTPVTLNIGEQLTALGQETKGYSSQALEWELGERTSFPGKPVTKFSDSTQLTFATPLEGAKDDKPSMQTHYLHITFKNEW